MGKIWVDIVPSASPDGDEAKSALTKPIIAKIEKAMCKSIIAGLPSNFSEKDADKPKDKRDDYAARAVRLVVGLKMSLEAKGPKVSTEGKGTVTLEMLNLKTANESGEFVGQTSAKVSGVEKRGAINDVLDKLTEQLLKEIDLTGMAKKLLSGSEFKKAAERRNMPLD
jgi:hypothetical protein